MGIKEKWIELKKKACDFYNEHKTGVKTAAIGIGAFALGSFATYRMLHGDNASEESLELTEPEEPEIEEEEFSWKEEFNDDWHNFENAAVQSFNTMSGGYSWIIAGPESFYNPERETIEIYLMNNEGDCIQKPEDDNEES